MAEKVLTQTELPFGLLTLVENSRGVEIVIEDVRGPGWGYRVPFPDALDYKALELVEGAEGEEDINRILCDWGPWQAWHDYLIFSADVGAA